MFAGTHNRARPKLKCLLFLLLPLLAAAEEGPRWALLVEPSFMDYQIRRPVAGSDRTILAVVRITDGEIEPLTREQKRGIPITFEQIETESGKLMAERLARLTPNFVRDKKGVIEYAELVSDDPLTASTVLAPGFAEKFRDTIGPDLVVAMPNRFQVYVFSRQDTIFRQMGEAVINGYLSSNYPVSREAFLLENGRLRSLGVYR